MLTKRIIPCLDVCEGKVVKGVQFKDHRIVGDIISYAQYYRDTGADELVFYDIKASSNGVSIDRKWVAKIACILDIPFCVAGGIRSVNDARAILNEGADKISINSPALENPALIDRLVKEFGSQCVVVGIDSQKIADDYFVYQYTGDPTKSRNTLRRTSEWVQQVQSLGAGEIVLNCMNSDGMQKGFDIVQLSYLRQIIKVPLIASGGAGQIQDFCRVFQQTNVDGALAAGVFHDKKIEIGALKKILSAEKIEVRL